MPAAVLIDPRRRVTALIAALALALTVLAWVQPAPARAAGSVTLAGDELHEALFVAGDADRLSTDPGAAFLERVLQRMYAVQPTLPAPEAITEIERLQRALEDATGGTPAPGDRRRHTLFRVHELIKQGVFDEVKKAAKASPNGVTRRAVRAVTKEVLADHGEGAGALTLTATSESWDGRAFLPLSADLVAIDTLRQARGNQGFGEARDGLWQDQTGQSVTATIQERLADPDLADAGDLTSHIDGDTLTISRADAEGAADKALNGSDGAAGVRGETLAAIAEVGAQEEKVAAATTEEERKKRQEELEKLQKQLGKTVEDAEKLLKHAKTVTSLAVQLISKFSPAAAESIKEIADVAFPIAEKVLGIAGSVVNGVMNVVTGNWVAAVGDAVSLLSGLGSLFFGDSATEPKPDPVAEALKGIKEDLAEFRAEMNQRFDRIDAALNTIFETLVTGLGELQSRLDAIGTDVRDVMSSLIVAQASLNRLEARVYEGFRTIGNRELNTELNAVLGYRERFGQPLPKSRFDTSAAYFYTWATLNALDPIALVSDVRDFDDAALAAELKHPLDSNVDYLRQFGAKRLGLEPLASTTLANPRDWAVAARAFEQLLLENPAYLTDGLMEWLDEIRGVGGRLRQALGRVVQADAPEVEGGTGSRLFDRLLQFYADRWEKADLETGKVIQQYVDALPAGIDPWEGPEQPVAPATPVTYATHADDPRCRNGSLLELGTDTVDPVPAAAKVGAALGAGTMSDGVCLKASWVDLEPLPTAGRSQAALPPGPGDPDPDPGETTGYQGRWHLEATWSYRDLSTGQRVAVTQHSRTDPEPRGVCLQLDGPTPGPRPRECDPQREAVTELVRRWEQIRDGIAWSPIDSGRATLAGWVERTLVSKQQEAYTRVHDALHSSAETPNPPLMRAVEALAPAKRLLAMYLETSVPGDLAADGELRGLLAGSESLVDPAAMAESWLRAATDPPAQHPQQMQDELATERIDRLRQVLRDHILGTTQEPVPPVETRLPGLVQGTLDRLELVAYVLRGPGPVVTITDAPTETDDPRPVLTFTAGEDASYECRIYAEGATAPGFGPCSGDLSHTPSSPLTPGRYRFDVRAADDAHNEGGIATAAFTITDGPGVPDPDQPGDPGSPDPGTIGPVAPGLLGLTLVNRPTVKVKGGGKATVGRRLKARPGTWAPGPATVTYQWLRGGKAIKGKAAKKRVYQLRPADRRKRISVRVTVQRPGYADGTVRSKAVRVR